MFTIQLFLRIYAEESFCINTSSISKSLVSFKLPTDKIGVLEVIGFNKMESCFYCLVLNGTEHQIIKINHFIRSDTIVAHIPKYLPHFMNNIF